MTFRVFMRQPLKAIGAEPLRIPLAQVFKYAVEYELREDNPVTGIDKLKTRTGGIASWSEKEIRQFEEYHPVGTRARVAFGLLLYTGQRRGDIVRLGRQHEDDGWLYFKQQKTGVEMAIPIFHELREILDAGPVGDLTYLVTEFGKPFTANGFGNKFRDWVEEAGLRGKSAHGVRTSAASDWHLIAILRMRSPQLVDGKHCRKCSATRRVRIVTCWQNRLRENGIKRAKTGTKSTNLSCKSYKPLRLPNDINNLRRRW